MHTTAKNQIDLVPSGMTYTVIVNSEGLCTDVEMKDNQETCWMQLKPILSVKQLYFSQLQIQPYRSGYNQLQYYSANFARLPG